MGKFYNFISFNANIDKRKINSDSSQTFFALMDLKFRNRVNDVLNCFFFIHNLILENIEEDLFKVAIF